MSSSVRNRIKRRLDPAALDHLVAALLLVAFQLQIWTAAHGHGRLQQAVTAVAITFAIAIRRRWTLQALLLTCAAFAAMLVFFAHQTGQGGLYPVSLLLLFYGVGLGIPFVLAGLAADRALHWSRGVRKHLGLIERVGGVVLVAMGILLFTGQLTLINIWAIRTFGLGLAL